MQKIYRNFQDFSLNSAFVWVNKTMTPVPSHGFGCPVSGGSVVTVGCEGSTAREQRNNSYKTSWMVRNARLVGVGPL